MLSLDSSPPPSEPKFVKASLSISEDVLAEIDAEAVRLNLTRSSYLIMCHQRQSGAEPRTLTSADLDSIAALLGVNR